MFLGLFITWLCVFKEHVNHFVVRSFPLRIQYFKGNRAGQNLTGYTITLEAIMSLTSAHSGTTVILKTDIVQTVITVCFRARLQKLPQPFVPFPQWSLVSLISLIGSHYVFKNSLKKRKEQPIKTYSMLHRGFKIESQRPVKTGRQLASERP